MATATKAADETKGLRPRRRAILPLDLRRGRDVERIQQLWPWYLTPFREPDVSPECRAYVLGEWEPDDDVERSLLLAELVNAHTVPADANQAIQQAPGACSAERQFYQRNGFRLLSPTAGESSGDAEQPYMIWRPQLDDGHTAVGSYGQEVLTDPYVGLRTVLASLATRQKWAIAQVNAKIEAATDMAKEGDGVSRRYNRAVVAALKRRLRDVENGLPTLKELQLFFVTFERLRLSSQQDRKLKEEQALQGRINDLGQQQQTLMGDIAAGIEGEWAPEGVPA